MAAECAELITDYAKKTFLALENPYGTVEKVFPLAINSQRGEKAAAYIGVKDHKSIPVSLIKKLEADGEYVLHTLDSCSLGGRAVDVNLKNPLTGNCMTGSSSGTALNVFYHINDLGIGTDGGGSVLAPAMSLQLFGFISSLIEKESMERFLRVSTDGLSFTPSVGFITRDWSLMKRTIARVLDIKREPEKPTRIFVSEKEKLLWAEAEVIPYPELDDTRKTLIAFLRERLPQCDFMVSYEGPVDVWGMGDSIFGHFDERTAQKQRSAGKGLIRVANMVNAAAVCVPDRKLGCAYVLLCEGTLEKIRLMLEYAEKLVIEEDELIGRYFGNLDLYFDRGYGEHS